MKRGGPPRRRTSNTAARREILVFTEGEKTEPQYLVGWHRANRSRVTVHVDPLHGSPLSLVRYAVQRAQEDKRSERRGQGSAYDEIWCMFDVDEHPNFAEACSLAKTHGIRTAISNPCMELWMLLHYEDRTSWIDRHEAQRKVRMLTGLGKSLTESVIAELMTRHDDAVSRAHVLDRKHADDGSPEGENPSSNVWRLIDSIRGTGTGKLA